MRFFPVRLGFRISVLAQLCFATSTFSELTTRWDIEAGPLQLEIHLSETAQLFHVVDQVSEWSQFCHQQYSTYFQKEGGLSEEDRKRLDDHAAIRKMRGWGGGLEQAFYTPLDLESALSRAQKDGLLTEEECGKERAVFAHFRQRIERLVEKEEATLRRFVQEMLHRQSELSRFATAVGRFVGCEKLRVPIFLIANPDPSAIGGGFNGGRLTLEIAAERDTIPSLLHELFHAFAHSKLKLVEHYTGRAANLDSETLNEGLAYACNPGIFRAGQGDQLLDDVARYYREKATLADAYARFNLYGLALRPLLKEALYDNQQTLETFLPRAIDVWRALYELETARGLKSKWQEHDYQKDSNPSIFLFGESQDPGVTRALLETTKAHIFGRAHRLQEYEEMLSTKAKPGDRIILLIALDDPEARVPIEFSDLLPLSQEQIASLLKQDSTVCKSGRARGFRTLVLAARTAELLQKEFARMVAERRIPE